MRCWVWNEVLTIYFFRFDRWKSGSRTEDPSSRNFTKTARFLWSTARTPATPWPATLHHLRPSGTITLARSTGGRSPSHPSVPHHPTWKITVITGIRRGHIYSIQCTTRDHRRAWGPCINKHWWKSFTLVGKDNAKPGEISWEILRQYLEWQGTLALASYWLLNAYLTICIHCFQNNSSSLKVSMLLWPISHARTRVGSTMSRKFAWF